MHEFKKESSDSLENYCFYVLRHGNTLRISVLKVVQTYGSASLIAAKNIPIGESKSSIQSSIKNAFDPVTISPK